MDGPSSRDECAFLVAGCLGLTAKQFRNAHPAFAAMYEIGRFAASLSGHRGSQSEIDPDDLAKALRYDMGDVSAWLRSQN